MDPITAAATAFAAAQTAVATITATANVTLNTTDYNLGTSLVDGYKIKVDYSGLYNVQFSIQFANDDSQIQDVDVWFKKNGSDVTGSNSKFSIDSKHGSVKGHLIASLNFNIELAKDDYVSLAWATTSTLVTVEHLAAQTTPTRPATPSAIVTIQYLSANSYTTNLFNERQSMDASTWALIYQQQDISDDAVFDPVCVRGSIDGMRKSGPLNAGLMNVLEKILTN